MSDVMADIKTAKELIDSIYEERAREIETFLNICEQNGIQEACVEEFVNTVEGFDEYATIRNPETKTIYVLKRPEQEGLFESTKTIYIPRQPRREGLFGGCYR